MRCRSGSSAEPTPDFPQVDLKKITYAEIYHQVHRAVIALKKLNLGPGDRVASYASNCIVSHAGLSIQLLPDAYCRRMLSLHWQLQPLVVSGFLQPPTLGLRVSSSGQYP